MQPIRMQAIAVTATVMVVLFGVAQPTLAQLNTQHLKGSAGLKSGTQAPAGEYILAPLVYIYSADEIRNRNGDSLPLDGSLDSVMFARGKNRVFALGPDVTLAIARNDTVYGFVTVRYQWETYARTTTQGTAWNIIATFPVKPMKVSS
ncbi:MAG: hypothetical protein ACRD3C_04455 [Vicinamibacterales bacterium]